MNIYYQEGGQAEGQEEQLMQLFQAFADIVQDDEFNTAEEVMQMFMELTPEEQQAFVQQAIQIVQHLMTIHPSYLNSFFPITSKETYSLEFLSLCI